ncbi:MAG: FtsW/RodA/SpoVE family cell cycle protein, partial [Enterococcus aquimarinus]
MPGKLKKHHLLDLGILIPYLILSVIGLMMVYSTTTYVQLVIGENTAKSAISQLAFWIVSLIVITIIYKMKLNFIKQKSLVITAMVIITVLLILAFFFNKVNGSWGWIPIPGVGTIQPAEFLKIIVVWFLAVILSNNQNNVHEGQLFHTIKGSLAAIVFQIILLGIYPDYGNAAIIVLLVMVVLLTSGVNFRLTI